MIDFSKPLYAKVFDLDSWESESEEKIIKVHTIEMPCKHHSEAIIWSESGFQFKTFKLIPQNCNAKEREK